MTSRAKAVVEAFEHLTPEEQMEAYLAIEKIWKDSAEQREWGAMLQPMNCRNRVFSARVH